MLAPVITFEQNVRFSWNCHVIRRHLRYVSHEVVRARWNTHFGYNISFVRVPLHRTATVRPSMLTLKIKLEKRNPYGCTHSFRLRYVRISYQCSWFFWTALAEKSTMLSKDWLTAKLLLDLANTAILGSQPNGTNDRALQSGGSESQSHITWVTNFWCCGYNGLFFAIVTVVTIVSICVLFQWCMWLRLLSLWLILLKYYCYCGYYGYFWQSLFSCTCRCTYRQTC